MSALFVDSHCHLNFEDYQLDLVPVLQSAKVQGIETMLSICTKVKEIDTLIDLAEKYPQIYSTIGIHPHEAEDTLKQLNVTQLKSWLHQYITHPKIVGIGEIGLDFHYNHSPQEAQLSVFRAHVEVALKAGLPVSIHTREAEIETISMLKKHTGISGVIHCFSGSKYLAQEALALGFYISISGIATFKKADDLRHIIKDIPLNRLLLETDSPYLAPIPFRGRRNEPSLLIHTAQEVAKLKEVTLEELASVTTQNFFTLFPKALETRHE